MNDKNIKRCFDIFNLNDKQKEQLLENIIQEKVKKKRKNYKLLLIAALISVGIFISVAGISAATTGDFFFGSFSEYQELSPKEAVEGNIFSTAEFSGVPDIEYIYNNESLIISNLRGLIIYNLNEEKVTHIVDLQKIKCNYFNSNSKLSCVYLEKDKLIIFNIKYKSDDTLGFSKFEKTSGKPYGKYYEYDLTSKNYLLKPCKKSNDNKLQSFYDKWCKHKEADYVWLSDLIDSDTKSSSSWNAIKIKENNNTYGILKFEDEKKIKYIILDDKGKEIKSVKLKINMVKEKLPEYKYTGNDKRIEAIVEYFKKKFNEVDYEETTYIPAYIIYGEAEENNETLIFGDFWEFGFVRSGNVLIEGNGGQEGACVHLAKNGNKYKVTKVEYVKDGEELIKSKKELTSGHPVIRLKWLYGDSDYKEALKESLREYVSYNNLSVNYYKSYGWDEEPIFD